MNLAIEYLQRSGAIQNFLRFPCSLFLENFQEERIVVCIRTSESNKLQITRWFLHRRSGGESLPPRKKNTINRDFVFQSKQVIVPDFEPLKYKEEPIPTARNRYYRPMDEKIYLFVLENYLNSFRHRRYRENWLWKAFCQSFRIPSRYNFLKSRIENDVYGMIAQEEQEEIKNSESWDNWMYWRENLLIESETAAELIFSSSFSSQKQTFLYVPEDML